MMTNSEPEQPHQPTMLSFSRDLPNICSLAGLLCAVLGIYFAILGNFPLAIIGVLWAVLFDWADGIVARKMTGRTDHKFSPWFLPGAFLIVATSAIRLSYFNIFGLIDDKTYMGLALDNNVLILAFVFLFEGFINHTVFSIILYALLMVFLLLNLAPIRTPKFAGKWFYVLMVYTFVLTVIYGWMQWIRV